MWFDGLGWLSQGWFSSGTGATVSGELNLAASLEPPSIAVNSQILVGAIELAQTMAQPTPTVFLTQNINRHMRIHLNLNL